MNCPLKQNKQCDEKQCAFWLILYRKNMDGKTVEEGKCAILWIPFLMTELRGSIENLRNRIEGGNSHESIN